MKKSECHAPLCIPDSLGFVLTLFTLSSSSSSSPSSSIVFVVVFQVHPLVYF